MKTCSDTYVGVDNDIYGGMTDLGRLVRDAWVFSLLPADETCAGWSRGAIEVLAEQVNNQWDRYGCLVSQLPPALASRHHSVHSAALETARAAGWSGELELEGDR